MFSSSRVGYHPNGMSLFAPAVGRRRPERCSTGLARRRGRRRCRTAALPATEPSRLHRALLHGAAGEDGALRDLLETLDIDYVGSDASGSRVAFDKPVASTLVSGTGVAVPEFVVMPQSTFRELGAPAVMAAIGDRIGFPLVVKPTRGGSALGVSIVRHKEDLPHAMVSAFAYGETVMIQRFISGTEVAVSVIDGPDGVRALPAVEIVPESGMATITPATPPAPRSSSVPPA